MPGGKRVLFARVLDGGAGVDACCLLQRLQRRPGEQREAHIGRALGRVAPSMLLCSLSEAVCFFLGEPGPPSGCGQGKSVPCTLA